MDHTRIPELKAKIEACRPPACADRRYFDEFTEPEELDAFCKLFGELDAPLGKNITSSATTTCSTTGGSRALAARIWSVGSPPRACASWRTRPSCCPAVCASWAARIIWYTNGSRLDGGAAYALAAPTTTTRSGSTMSRRDFKNAAAAGADLILQRPHPRRTGLACGCGGHGCQK